MTQKTNGSRAVPTNTITVSRVGIKIEAANAVTHIPLLDYLHILAI